MNVLILGHGKGSFAMRARQLGAAIGARVAAQPTDADLRWADVVVLIKRAAFDWASVVHCYDRPLVWDALDFWQQPDENHLIEAQARALLKAAIQVIDPALVICATEAMADACQGVYLPHQTWPDLVPASPRTRVKTVGYQGKRQYLGAWATAIQAECERRGWAFLVNPPDLRACDLLVAFRDAKWDGWMCQEWKSAVKLGNAIAAGRPIVTQPSAAFRELQPDGATIQTPAELSWGFDVWEPLPMRESAYTDGLARHAALSVTAIAAQYRQMLSGVVKAQAA
jgi:hypothetical protein